MFAHGESKEVSLDLAMKSLKIVMKNSGVNLVYAQENKQENLEKFGLESDFICVQDLLRLYKSDNMKMPMTEAVENFS